MTFPAVGSMYFMKFLIVVDMQNDFIDGALGTSEAVAIVPYVKSVIENFDGKVFFTRDTHFENYMDTREGKNLPVKHCIKGSFGWEVYGETAKALAEVEAYCNREAEGVLELVAEQIAVIKLNRSNTEGLTSQSFSGVSESYLDGYPKEITDILRSKRKIKFI